MTTTRPLARLTAPASDLVDAALALMGERERAAILDVAETGDEPTIARVMEAVDRHRASERIVLIAFGFAPRIRRDPATGKIRRDGWTHLIDCNERCEVLVDLIHDAEFAAWTISTALRGGLQSALVTIRTFSTPGGTPND